MKNELEKALLNSGELMKKSGKALIANVSRIIAILTVIIAALVLFTDAKYSSLSANELTPTLLIMLIASYVIYFSLEDSGERLGEDSEEYKIASEKFLALSGKIGGESIVRLREFCKRYSIEELRFRRESLLFSYGYSIEEYESYKASPSYVFKSKKERRAFHLADALKTCELTPKLLLSTEKMSRKSELMNPEYSKLLRMIISLIPTSLCMIVTLSVMLTAKDGMTAADVIEALFKLMTLVIIGFRGYVSGYNYKKSEVPLWLDTRRRILDAFLKEEGFSEKSEKTEG